MCVVRAAVNQKVRLATITSARPAPQDAGKDQTLAARVDADGGREHPRRPRGSSRQGPSSPTRVVRNGGAVVGLFPRRGVDAIAPFGVSDEKFLQRRRVH
jgi:hypothetical protein